MATSIQNVNGVMENTRATRGIRPVSLPRTVSCYSQPPVMVPLGRQTSFSFLGRVCREGQQPEPAGWPTIDRACHGRHGWPGPRQFPGTVLPIYGGNYTLSGLKKTGNSYQCGGLDRYRKCEVGGSWGMELIEDGNVVYPAGILYEGESRINQDISISPPGAWGEAPLTISITGVNGGGYQIIGAGFPSSDLRVSVRDSSDALTSTPTATEVSTDRLYFWREFDTGDFHGHD